MNEIQIFNNPEFGDIRTVEIGGEPWLVGKDVATALGYEKPTDAVRKRVDEEDRGISKMETPSGVQEMTIINESGLYSLVLSSKLPGAKKFRRWVTSEVLPSIRRNGHYGQSPDSGCQEKALRVETARLLVQIAARYTGTSHEKILHANAVRELTGELLLPLPKSEAPTYSAGEIGEMLGISEMRVSSLATQHGLKSEKYGNWFRDTAGYFGDEVAVFRYYDSVVPMMKMIIEFEEAQNRASRKKMMK